MFDIEYALEARRSELQSMSNDSTLEVPDEDSRINGSNGHERRLFVPLKGMAMTLHCVLAGERRRERKLLLQRHEIEGKYASITVDLPECGGLRVGKHEMTRVSDGRWTVGCRLS